MKKTILLLSLLPFISYSQQVKKQIVKSNIDKVNLYLTAGEMIHKQDVKLTKGRNKVVFTGISAYANPQSIQFNGSGDYKLVSVSTEMDFLAAEEFNPRISDLNDSLEVMKFAQQDTEDELGAYYAEQAILNTDRNIGGKNESLTVAQIKAAADFYRERTLEVNRKISALKKRKTKINSLIEDTRYQLVELNYNENQRSNQVVILVDASKEMTSSTVLKYLVSDCGWAATYDLSATDIDQKINLKYKAQVYNNTGNDWSNVDLMLSTGDPKLSAAHPELATWYLNTSVLRRTNTLSEGNGYIAPQSNEIDYRSGAVSSMNIANQRAYDNYVLDKKEVRKSGSFQIGKIQNKNGAAVKMKNIEISELAAEFVVKNKFNCPSDAKPYIVDVKEMNLDAVFSHITVPKLDRSAFLMANIVGWQELDLIPGPTNVYFGGNYVGVSRIDTRNVSDTLSLSFGRDNQVVVMRKLKSEMSTKKVVGSSKRDSYMYELIVRNNRNVPINITVHDQVPISTSSAISISDDELSDGIKSEITGEVTWKLKISPSDIVKKEIGYTVKYPKNEHVSVKKFRTISAPSF